MPLHQHDTSPHHDPSDEPRLSVDRVLTRRRMLAITGAALAPLLIACGDEAEPEEIPDQVDPPEAPDLDPEEPGMDAPNEDLENPEEDEGG